MSDVTSITKIKPTQRDAARATVFVGKKAVGTLPQRILSDLGVHVGAAWTAELAQTLEQAVDRDKALRAAARRVARRPMSKSQIQRKLRELGHEPEAIDAAIDRLEQLGAVDDEAMARLIVEQELNRKPAGARLLRAKLAQRGIDRKLADRAVEAAAGERDAVTDAMSLAEKKLRSMQRLDEPTKKRRLWGALARRGFDSDVIRDVMETLRWEEE